MRLGEAVGAGGNHMKKLKVVIIGAGSATFGGGTIVDLVSSPELREFDLTVSLVDIDSAALNRITKLAALVKEHYRSSARIESTPDRKEALKGANYVIISVAQRRWDLWEKDFYIPAAFGFRHVFGETAGPGAAFHTLRSLHVMMPICQDIESICPEALVLNFTNPESRVCMGISMLTKLHCVGLCHGPFATLERIADILQKPSDEIELTVAGINHFHWATKIQDRKTGRDLYPDIETRIDSYDWDIDNLTPLMYKLFGLLTYPAPSHPGEYVNFAHAVSGPHFLFWGLGQVSRKFGSKASDLDYVIEGKSKSYCYHMWSLDVAEKLDRIVAGKEPLGEQFTQPTRELAIPIICDIELDRKRRELSGNVLNTGRAIRNLAEDAIVELPLLVDAQGVHPVDIGSIPEAIAGMCGLQISIQKLIVEAYQERSKKLLLQALVIDPIVDDVGRAREMMEFMLRVESEYLPLLR